MSKKARAEVRFQGKVQGVFFRINTRKFAIGNGVAGEVKNCPDGSVKAVFEGERKNIEMTIRLNLENRLYGFHIFSVGCRFMHLVHIAYNTRWKLCTKLFQFRFEKVYLQDLYLTF